MSQPATLEDEPQIHQTTEAKLVYMANQIADFFASKPHDVGVAGVSDHIRRFWDPRMRSRMFAHLDATQGAGLKPLALQAITQLRAAAS